MTATSDTIAYLFPGQGSQKPGMGAAWAETFAEAKAVFDEADRVLGFPLSRLCFEGPEDQLNLTANTQPALLTVSTAIHRVLRRAELAPVAMAGHSLGEWSALVAAGALAFEDALKLVRRRGELMQQAVPPGEGAIRPPRPAQCTGNRPFTLALRSGTGNRSTSARRSSRS